MVNVIMVSHIYSAVEDRGLIFGHSNWSLLKINQLTRFSDCPCELNCLDGCDDCANPVCDCQVSSFRSPSDRFDCRKNVKINIKVVEENPDWNRCIDDNSLKLGRCVHACNDNEDCEDDCLSRFKTRQLNCPCEVS